MKAMTLYRPTISNGIDRYLDSFFEDNFLPGPSRALSRLPSVDVRETEQAYLIEAELPGYDEKAIEIRLDGGNLSIESKKAEETKEEKVNYLLRERRTSSFKRSFKLPENASSEGITATYKNGILNLEVPKKPEAQPRMIPIN